MIQKFLQKCKNPENTQNTQKMHKMLFFPISQKVGNRNICVLCHNFWSNLDLDLLQILGINLLISFKATFFISNFTLPEVDKQVQNSQGVLGSLSM